MTTARRVSGLERVWLAADRIAPPFAIHLVVEWPGPLDVERWRAAVQVAAGPGMRLRLRGALRWARWVVVDEPVPVEVVDDPWDGQGPTPWLTAPLPPDDEPVRVSLVPPNGEAPARAVFSAQHAVTDGRGLWRFVCDTARALAGEAVEPPPAGPMTDLDLARALGVEPLRPVASDASAPCPSPPDQPVIWRRRRLPVGPNVLPRLAAAFARAAEPGARLRFSVPVDLRRYAAEADRESSANLTGITYLELTAETSPAAIRAAIDEAVGSKAAARHPLAAEFARHLPLGLIAAVGRRAARADHRRGTFGASLALSHLGRHALTIDGHPARVAFVPPGMPGLPLFVGVTVDPSGVEMVGCGPVEPGALDGLLDRVGTQFASESDAGQALT